MEVQWSGGTERWFFHFESGPPTRSLGVRCPDPVKQLSDRMGEWGWIGVGGGLSISGLLGAKATSCAPSVSIFTRWLCSTQDETGVHSEHQWGNRNLPKACEWVRSPGSMLVSWDLITAPWCVPEVNTWGSWERRQERLYLQLSYKSRAVLNSKVNFKEKAAV